MITQVSLDILSVVFQFSDTMTKSKILQINRLTQKLFDDNLKWLKNVHESWTEYYSFYGEYSSYNNLLDSEEHFKLVCSIGPNLSKEKMFSELKKIYPDDIDFLDCDFLEMYESSYLFFGPIKYIDWTKPSIEVRRY